MTHRSTLAPPSYKSAVYTHFSVNKKKARTQNSRVLVLLHKIQIAYAVLIGGDFTSHPHKV